MSEPMIRPGIVIRDPYGFEGIVCAAENAPPQEWINAQLRAEEIMQLGAGVQWWGILVICGSGGYALFPEPMLTLVRQATFEDFLAAADSANTSGRQKLAKLFPEYLNRVLEIRKHQ